MRLFDGRFEGWHVNLAQGPLADLLVDARALRFLVVGEEMLHIRDHAGALDAFNIGHDDTGVEPRVLAIALEDSASLGHARNVYVGRFEERAAQRTGLLGFQLAVGPGQFRIPGGGQRNRRGHGGSGLLRSRASGSHTGGAVCHLEIGNAEPGQARHEAVMRRIA